MRTARYRLVMIVGDPLPPMVILDCGDGPAFFWGAGIPVGGGKSIEELTVEDLPLRPLAGTNPPPPLLTPVGRIRHGKLQEMLEWAREHYAAASQREAVAA